MKFNASQFATLLFVSTLFFQSSAFAYDDEFYGLTITGYEKTVLPLLRSNVRPDVRNLIDETEIVLIKNPWLPTVVGTNPQTKKVVVSLGFLDGLFNFVDCTLIEEKLKAKRYCDEYFDYYFKRITNQDEQKRLPWSAARLYFANREARIKQWYNDENLRNSRHLLYFSGFINVMVHEYGHHFEGFSKPSSTISEQRNIEGRVDRWSYALLSKMGERPLLGATVSLGYLSQMERYREQLSTAAKDDPDFIQIPSGHPKPKQRAQWAHDITCKNAVSLVKVACDKFQRKINTFQ